MQPNHLPSPQALERLRMDNDFMKMKLMLEQGAQCFSPKGVPPDPLAENLFLREVLAFEEKHRVAPLIRVADKLGRLTDFAPADELTDRQLETEILRLRERLHQRGIHLATLSPNVDLRELYRFMTGPFLELPMRDLDAPGIYCFVYDDFHPDPYYENEWTALECCIRPLLNLAPLKAFLEDGDQVRLNHHPPMRAVDCRKLIAQFRQQYSSMVPLRCDAVRTAIRDCTCTVSGFHETGLCTADHCEIIRGQWRVEFQCQADDHWRISQVWIEGLCL